MLYFTVFKYLSRNCKLVHCYLSLSAIHAGPWCACKRHISPSHHSMRSRPVVHILVNFKMRCVLVFVLQLIVNKCIILMYTVSSSYFQILKQRIMIDTFYFFFVFFIFFKLSINLEKQHYTKNFFHF